MNWRQRAKCIGIDPEIFFTAIEYETAKLVCKGCPVRFECLMDGVQEDFRSDGGPYGVWGGLTPDERKPLGRKLRK